MLGSVFVVAATSPNAMFSVFKRMTVGRGRQIPISCGATAAYVCRPRLLLLLLFLSDCRLRKL